MERIAAASALTGGEPGHGPLVAAAPPHSVARDPEYSFALASQGDDAEIRRLLRDAIFPGDVRLSMESEPDSLAAGPIFGDVHQTIVARHGQTDHLAAIASRSVRTRFVNGEAVRVGYLGALRIALGFRRRRRLLDAGFEFCRRLHEEGDTRLYLTSVVSENLAALRLLGRRSPFGPRFEAIGRLVTLVIPVRRSNHDPAGVHVIGASDAQMDDLLACLRRNSPRYQFAPAWSAHELTGATPGLTTNDFAVARCNGRMIGCAALWDQRSFRQVIVRGYGALLAAARPLVNASAPWTGVPRLPRAGARLEFGYVSHLAVDGDDPLVTRALIAYICRAAQVRRLDYVAIGLPAAGALSNAVCASFRHRAYESDLLVAFWPDGERIAATLDGRPYLPELGTL